MTIVVDLKSDSIPHVAIVITGNDIVGIPCEVVPAQWPMSCGKSGMGVVFFLPEENVRFVKTRIISREISKEVFFILD